MGAVRYPLQCKYCGAPESDAFGREKTIALPDEVYYWIASKAVLDDRVGSPVKGDFKLIFRGRDRDFTIIPESAR